MGQIIVLAVGPLADILNHSFQNQPVHVLLLFFHANEELLARLHKHIKSSGCLTSFVSDNGLEVCDSGVETDLEHRETLQQVMVQDDGN